MATKRWREPTPKRGVLEARFGKLGGNEPDLLYVHGGGSCSGDVRVLANALEGVAVYDNKPLRQVLIDRGYDITTLRFSVSLLSLEPR